MYKYAINFITIRFTLKNIRIMNKYRYIILAKIQYIVV